MAMFWFQDPQTSLKLEAAYRQSQTQTVEQEQPGPRLCLSFCPRFARPHGSGTATEYYVHSSCSQKRHRLLWIRVKKQRSSFNAAFRWLRKKDSNVRRTISRFLYPCG